MSQQNDDSKGIKILDRPKPKNKVSEPPFYKVILLNDDYTPMDFVTHVLQKFFGKNKAEADFIMLQVHNQGRGVAGIYNYETAETKMHLVNTYSDQQRHPLQCILEKD